MYDVIYKDMMIPIYIIIYSLACMSKKKLLYYSEVHCVQKTKINWKSKHAYMCKI